MRAHLLVVPLALGLLAALPARAAKGLYECEGPKGEHYFSDKGCHDYEPPPPVKGGTMTLLPGRTDKESPTIKNPLHSHDRFVQRAETNASKHEAAQERKDAVLSKQK